MGDPNRGNYQIWIISALLAAIMGFTYFSKSNAALTITERRFEEMLLSNDVEKVILIKNKDLVEVTLKPDALQNSKYKLELDPFVPGFAPSTQPSRSGALCWCGSFATARVS
jgi:cell division protease FtsH